MVEGHADPTSGPRMAVVCVNYASHDLLAANLDDEGLREARIDVVVVDNHRGEAATESIRALSTDRGWDLVVSPTNVGFGCGMNLGVERALATGHDVVAMVNPDVVLPADVAVRLRDAAAANPDALITPVILRGDGRPWFTGGRIDMATGRVSGRAEHTAQDGTGWLTGACLVVSRDLWQRSGGFDPDYFLYWEDVDLSRRVVDAGGHLLVLDDVTVIHDVGGTQGPGEAKSPLYIYYNCRNPLLYAAKHLDARTRRRWMLRAPRSSWLVLLRGERRHLPSVWAGGMAALRGTTTGLVRAVRS